MLKRIQAGEAAGIIAWHPDRLARNSVDGGQIIFLLDTRKIQALKFPRHWFENTPQGKLMLNNEFGFSKYYFDSLSENTKRGLREKVHRGEFPGFAPLGYLKQKLLGRGFMARVLSNPFYYGHFRYCGEVHEGRHEALITKKLFDDVQAVLKGRAKASSATKKVPKVFLGLLQCADCGGAITAEIQKGHTYYRCTKKNRISAWCTQPYMREEALAEEIKTLLSPFCLFWRVGGTNALTTQRGGARLGSIFRCCACMSPLEPFFKPRRVRVAVEFHIESGFAWRVVGFLNCQIRRYCQL